MAKSTIITALNRTGTTLVAGSVVYISGFDDESKLSTVAIADNRDEARMPAIGVVREDIEDGVSGVVKVGGPVIGFDTTNANINDDVFVGTEGQITLENPLELDDDDVLSQQLGTVISIDEEPNGQINLFPLEIRRKIKHTELRDVFEDQHHVELHAEQHRPGGRDEFVHAQQHQPGGGDEFIHSSQHAAGGGDELSHSDLPNLDSDDHTQYSLVDGTRAFTGTVGGIYPAADSHLATKKYVDDQVIGEEFRSPIIDIDLTSPPGTPSSGDRYIVAGAGGTATGDWSGQEDKIAQYNGSTWDFTTPDEGWVVWVADEDVLYGYTDSYPSGSWQKGSAGEANTASNLGGGEGVFAQKSGVDLEFKSLIGGTGISLSSDANEITIDSTSSGGVPEITFQENKAFWNEAVHHLIVAADGYSGGGGGSPAGSDGAIQFNSSGSFGADTSNLFWDDANNRLGVGTNSPSVDLNILGQLEVESTNYPPAVVKRDTGGTNSNHAGVLRLTAQSTAASIVDGFGSHIDYALGDSGGEQTIGRLGFERDGADDSSKFYMDTSSSGTLATQVVVDSDGNVGIGDTIPDVKLQVEESSNSVTAFSLNNFDSGSSAHAQLRIRGNSNHLRGEAFSTTYSGTLGGQSLAEAVSLRGSSSSKLLIGTDDAAPIHIYTNDSLAMTITDDQLVAIGSETAPSVRLQITESVDATEAISIHNTNSGSSATAQIRVRGNSNHLYSEAYSTTYSGTLGGQALAEAISLRAISSSRFLIGSVDSAPIHIYTDDTHALTVDTSQQIGIGTTSPSRLTHINATSNDAILRIENSGNGNVSAIEFFRERSSGTGHGAAAIRSASDTSTNTGYLEFLVQTSTDALSSTNIFTLIGDGGGNDRSVAIGENFAVPQATKPPQNSLVVESMIGIGLMSPSNALHIESSGDQVAKIHSTSGDASLDLHNDVNGNYSGITFTRRRSSGPDATGGVIRMQSDTTTNTAFLEFLVETSVGLTSTSDRAMTLVGDGSGNGQSVAIGNTYATPSGTTPPANSLVVEGQLGIGVFSPSEKVEVDGGIIIGSALGTTNGTIQYTGSDFEGRVGGSWVSLTSGSGGGGVSETTFQEHKSQQSQINNTILSSLDGYASDQTVSEHYIQHSEAIDTIRKELDGYTTTASTGVSEQTFQEHKTQQSEINNTILDALDGYGTGTGTGNIDGSGQDGYLAVFSDEDTILGEPELYFDRDDGYLGVGTTEPNERITAEGAISLKEVSEPIAEAGFGKLYVNVKNGRVFFKRDNGENLDLTAFDIDGGNFLDTFETTRNFDAGTFTS